MCTFIVVFDISNESKCLAKLFFQKMQVYNYVLIDHCPHQNCNKLLNHACISIMHQHALSLDSTFIVQHCSLSSLRFYVGLMSVI